MDGVVAEEVSLLEGVSVLVFKDLSGMVVVVDIMYVVFGLFFFVYVRKGVTGIILRRE